MDDRSNYIKLKNLCTDLGAQLFGIADISAIKGEFQVSEKVRDAVDRAVSIGISISSLVLEDIENAPNKLYFHHYRTVNAFLDQRALSISMFIEGLGYKALPVPASQILDWQNQTALLSHKKVGVLAGLGWIGRNNLLVNSECGSRFRLATVLTNMPLSCDTPAVFSCGSCQACLQACPAKAIKEKPEDFDHQACFAQLKEFQRQKLVDQYICGVCVKVCAGTKGRPI